MFLVVGSVLSLSCSLFWIVCSLYHVSCFGECVLYIMFLVLDSELSLSFSCFGQCALSIMFLGLESVLSQSCFLFWTGALSIMFLVLDSVLSLSCCLFWIVCSLYHILLIGVATAMAMATCPLPPDARARR